MNKSLQRELLGLCGYGGMKAGKFESRHLQEAQSGGLLPFLGWRIRAGYLPADATARVPAIRSFRHQVGEALKRDEMVRSMGKIFRDRGIAAIAYKGWPLALEVYPEEGSRSMSDLDLLIHPSLWEKGKEVLSLLGFSPIHHPKHRMTLRFYHELHFRSPEGLLVDLHRRPFPWPLFRAGFAEIRSVSHEEDYGLWFPDREALFVLVGMHAAMDAFRVPPRAILDGLVLEDSGLNRDRVREYAIRWRARRALGMWLRILVNHGLSSQWGDLSRALAPETERLPEVQSGKWARRRVISRLQDQRWRAGLLALLRALFRVGDVMMRAKRP